MALSQISNRRTHLQSVSNFALSQVILEALLMPNSKADEGRLRMVRDEPDLDYDPVGPARGIVNGLKLSVTLWSFIALVVLLMR